MLGLRPSSTLLGMEEGEVEESWGKRKMKIWIGEGEEQAELIGRRYGLFGYEKESLEDRALRKSVRADGGAAARGSSGGIGGDVANLVVAYIVVKVCLFFVYL